MQVNDDELGKGGMDKSGIVDETPVTLSTAAGPELASAQVFVSYRVGDDVELAEALKALIADSVTPQPEVFVSSKGGLKPSRLGLKPQLQKAVQGSSIVVGVITGNSVDRDWVIFEAGAAWGLGAPYAPVLHDVTAEEMPSVYGDNYAHRSTDRNEMLSLVTAVADLTGGRVRGQFSARYRKYRDVVVNYVRSKNPTRAMTFLSEADYETSEDSYFLFAQGREDEAQKQIEQRVNDTQENDEKARILSEQLIYQKAQSNIEKVKNLESWPQELRETYSYIYWRAVFEPDKSIALSMIDDAIKKGVKTGDERAALLHKLQLLSLLSRHDDAREVFRGIVESSDIEQVQMAVRHFRTESTIPDCRMIIDVFGYKVCRADEFSRGICGYAIDNKLPSIAMWAATNDFIGGADGAKHLALGQAYMVAGLNGLAYQSFEHAGNAGFPVAKVNIANLCMQGPTPAAADGIMSSHKGKWYSNDLEYPHLIAGQAAKAMQAEQLQVSPMIEAGGQAFHVLADLLDRNVLSLETFADMPDVLKLKSFNVEYEKMEDNGPDGATYKLIEGKEFEMAEVKLETIYPFTRLFRLLVKGVTWGYAMFDQGHQYSTFATKWSDSKPTVIKDLFEFSWKQE